MQRIDCDSAGVNMLFLLVDAVHVMRRSHSLCGSRLAGFTVQRLVNVTVLDCKGAILFYLFLCVRSGHPPTCDQPGIAERFFAGSAQNRRGSAVLVVYTPPISTETVCCVLNHPLSLARLDRAVTCIRRLSHMKREPDALVV